MGLKKNMNSHSRSEGVTNVTTCTFSLRNTGSDSLKVLYCSLRAQSGVNEAGNIYNQRDPAIAQNSRSRQSWHVTHHRAERLDHDFLLADDPVYCQAHTVFTPIDHDHTWLYLTAIFRPG